MTRARMNTSLRQAVRAGTLGAILTVSVGAVEAAEIVHGYFDDKVRVEELDINSSSAAEFRPVISPDGDTLVFSSNRADGVGGADLYMAWRPGSTGAFEVMRNLTEINTTVGEPTGCISTDGRELFFSSNRPGGAGSYDLYVATRGDDDPDTPFGAPSPLTLLSDEDEQAHPWISRDGTELYYTRANQGIWVARRDGPLAEFATEPEPVFATQFSENGPSLSADGMTLFFGEWTPVRPNGMGASDLYMVQRSERSESFSEPEINLGAPVSSVGCDTTPSISSDWPADGATIYFAHSAGCVLGLTDIYRATWHVIPPAPAFVRGDSNDDGEVETSDAVHMLNWLFAGGPAPGCLASADINADEAVNIADPVSLLNHLFAGAPAPVAPYPECGTSELPADEELGCEEPPVGCQ